MITAAHDQNTEITGTDDPSPDTTGAHDPSTETTCTGGGDPEAEIEAPARGVSLEFPGEEVRQETADRIPGKKDDVREKEAEAAMKIDPPQILGLKKGALRVKWNRLSRRHGDL